MSASPSAGSGEVEVRYRRDGELVETTLRRVVVRPSVPAVERTQRGTLARQRVPPAHHL